MACKHSCFFEKAHTVLSHFRRRCGISPKLQRLREEMQKEENRKGLELQIFIGGFSCSMKKFFFSIESSPGGTCISISIPETEANYDQYI